MPTANHHIGTFTRAHDKSPCKSIIVYCPTKILICDNKPKNGAQPKKLIQRISNRISKSYSLYRLHFGKCSLDPTAKPSTAPLANLLFSLNFLWGYFLYDLILEYSSMLLYETNCGGQDSLSRFFCLRLCSRPITGCNGKRRSAENEEDQCKGEMRASEISSYLINRQNGIMAEWQNGRMVEWQNGRMAE